MLQHRSLLLALVTLLLVTTASAREAKEQARIEFLLRTVETSGGVKFIRNGTAHDAADAASHLRRKLDHGGKRIQTAEQFIEHAASMSSMTGRKYKVRLADGTTLDADIYFTRLLREFDAEKP